LSAGSGWFHDRVLCLYIDRDDALWIGWDAGAVRFDGRDFMRITKSAGLSNNIVQCVYRDGHGTLWFGTRGGASRFDGAVWSTLTKADGLASSVVQTICQDHSAALWFGTDRGVTRYTPPTATAPSPRVTAVLDKTFEPGAALPPIERGRRVEFKLDVVDLKTHRELRRFRWQVFPGKAAAEALREIKTGQILSEPQFAWNAAEAGECTLAVQYIDRDMNYSPLALVPLTVFTPWYANARVMVPSGGAVAGLVVWAFVARSLVARRKRETERLREQLLAEERRAREAAEKAGKEIAAKNAQLEEAKPAADEANASKSQFLASVSHELRTPLNAIIGYSEMVQELAEENGHQTYVPDLQKIQAAAKHQLSLVNDILDLAKIEAGKMTLFIEEFDVASLVREVEATVQPLVAKNANRLEVDCPTDLGTIRADQTKVRQTLFNLLSNACKFTEKGTIRLEVRRSEMGVGAGKPEVERAANEQGAPELRSSNSYLRFRLSDTGIGMTLSSSPNSFRPSPKPTRARPGNTAARASAWRSAGSSAR
jgi:signal transduction histidine kinase